MVDEFEAGCKALVEYHQTPCSNAIALGNVADKLADALTDLLCKASADDTRLSDMYNKTFPIGVVSGGRTP